VGRVAGLDVSFSDFQFPGPDRRGEKLDLSAPVVDVITAVLSGIHWGRCTDAPLCPSVSDSRAVPACAQHQGHRAGLRRRQGSALESHRCGFLSKVLPVEGLFGAYKSAFSGFPCRSVTQQCLPFPYFWGTSFTSQNPAIQYFAQEHLKTARIALVIILY
jgi:hypothetical protein